MIEEEFAKAGVGTLRVIGDPERGFTVDDISFGEYVDLSGKCYPVSKEQLVGIVTLAHEEWQAIAIAGWHG